MPVIDGWFHKSPQASQAQNNYHDRILDMQKEYEDPQYYYPESNTLPQVRFFRFQDLLIE